MFKFKKQFPNIEKNLWLYFATSNFLISLLTALIMASIYFILVSSDLIPENLTPSSPMIMILLTSGITAAFVTTFIGRVILTPLNHFTQATQKVAKGDFSIQIEEKFKLMTLQNMTSNFNIMVKELASIETLRSDFINNVSHEFKTPLTAIEGYAMLIQSETISKEDFHHYVNMIIDSTQQLSNVTSNILLLSKLEQEDLIQEKHLFRLDEQLRQCILQLEPLWSEKELALDIELDSATFMGTENLLFQVWINLLSNAIKFSYDKGLLRISLSKQQNQIIIKIQDSGIGMDKNTLDHIFDKFFQGETSRSHEGSGLGLSLVKTILDLHEANISYESQLNTGTIVTLILTTS